MTPETLVPGFAWLAPRILLLFGLAFLVANIKLGASLTMYRRRKRAALLTWVGARPRHYAFSLALGVILGVLLIVDIVVLQRSARSIFGEAMMFLYYGYVFPLSTRIRRGFYGDGIWSDSGFMPWSRIAAVSWKEGATVTLVLISRARNIARRLEVPGPLYGQARRVLRDRIKAHDIHFGGAGLDLGSRDEQDAV
jgi:hypothetical protein